MRKMTQLTRMDRWLAHITDLSDGLSDLSQSSTAQCGPSPVRSPRAPSKTAPKKRPLESWVNGSMRWLGFPQERAIAAKSGCSRGKQQRKHCTQREWCPESLVDLVCLGRRGGHKH